MFSLGAVLIGADVGCACMALTSGCKSPYNSVAWRIHSSDIGLTQWVYTLVGVQNQASIPYMPDFMRYFHLSTPTESQAMLKAAVDGCALKMH